MLSLHREMSKRVVTARRRLRNIPVKVSKNKQRNVEEVWDDSEGRVKKFGRGRAGQGQRLIVRWP